MLKLYRQVLEILNAGERRRLALLLAMILVMGFIDLAGVASILPFLAVLSDPGLIESNVYLAKAMRALDVTEPNQALIYLGLFTFCLVVFGQLFKALTIYAIVRFSLLREYAIGARLLQNYLHQPYSWFLNRHSSDLGVRVLSEVQHVVQGVLIPFLRVVAQGVVCLFLIILLLVVQPIATAAMLGVLGISYLAIFVFTRKFLNRIGRERIVANKKRYRIVQDSLRGVKDVKVLGLESTFLSRFRSPAKKYARLQSISSAIRETPRYLLEAIIFGAMTLMLLVLVIKWEGRLEEVLPIIGVYAFAGMRLFPAMQQLYRNASSLRFNHAAIETLHAELRETAARAERAASEGSDREIPLNDRLELRDVHFAYDGSERAALCGLDLAIDVNTTVGLVGVTGSGKTTAVDVILGLLEPQTGALVVDGETISSDRLRAWQRTLGYVPQEIFLVDDSVAANIALGMASDAIDRAAVERAARLANIHDFVTNELADGYDTNIGEAGVRLSGGQRQRIGIARALYRDPDVLILDEATSSLDTVTERTVMDAVNNLAHRKTIIMIAHRLSTVCSADKIFLLEAGRCIGSGTFDELKAQNEIFREMVVGA